MAGEIEDPFSIRFQADSFHSGSISFGRFEKEPLDWERRSSFSHNRYLEEVEKCLKPGSVIEKKAFLEAHFKKKGLPSPGLCNSPNCGDYQTRETDALENEAQKNEFDNVKEGNDHDYLDESFLGNVGYSDKFNSGNEEIQYQYVNEVIHESPEASQYHGHCAREDPAVLSAASHIESALGNADAVVDIEGALDNADAVVDSIPEDVNPEETCQTANGIENLHLNGSEPVKQLKWSLNDNAVNVDELSKHLDLSPKNNTAVEVDSSSEYQYPKVSELSKHVNLFPRSNTAVKVYTISEHQSPKVWSRTSTESKPASPRLRSNVNVNKLQNNLSHGALKTAAKTQNRRERKSPAKMKEEKQSSQTVIPNRYSLHRTLKAEGSNGCDARLNHENKSSEKELRARKIVVSEPSTLDKEPRAYQDASRPRDTLTLTKPDVRPTASNFSFKSDERAQRRKEFYMKLEEKTHAKEAEMNQIKARKQEKKEDEIKRLRRSLNFKATPMPSFYHTAVPAGSDRNKAVSCSNSKPATSCKSMSPGSNAVKSPSLPRARNNGVIPTNESVKSRDTTGPPESGSFSATPQTKHNRDPDTGRKNGITGKEQLGKEKDANTQKQRGSVLYKLTKDGRIEGKLKVGPQRYNNEMVRKSMKDTGICSSSGMSYLAVGVAS
ncbi:TPX2 domain-containing protein [Cephalotus follicularis]|uniref:TPX2 domain-containing protein n=1 Tax=Cephalotus follicularis TaxID=3775 RepID=A0A1Q3D5Q9_CEPFO|nr:TPX2 domain-containing protein [Cephalotus follicularis]